MYIVLNEENLCLDSIGFSEDARIVLLRSVSKVKEDYAVRITAISCCLPLPKACGKTSVNPDASKKNISHVKRKTELFRG